jgi:hypothetical protein
LLLHLGQLLLLHDLLVFGEVAFLEALDGRGPGLLVFALGGVGVFAGVDHVVVDGGADAGELQALQA